MSEEVFGFSCNAVVQPVEYREGTPAGWDEEPTGGGWEPAGSAVDVLRVPLKVDEKVRAGIATDTEASNLYLNLVLDGNGKYVSPVATTQTLEMDGKRYNVKSVAPYDIEGFDRIAVAVVERSG